MIPSAPLEGHQRSRADTEQTRGVRKESSFSGFLNFVSCPLDTNDRIVGPKLGYGSLYPGITVEITVPCHRPHSRDRAVIFLEPRMPVELAPVPRMIIVPRNDTPLRITDRLIAVQERFQGLMARSADVTEQRRDALSCPIIVRILV